MIAALLLAASVPSAIDAEYAFARDAQRIGQWTAFRKYADRDAVMFTPQAVWARDFLQDRKDPPKAVSWRPTDSFVSCDGRTAADNATVRTVFVIGPDKKIKLIIVYPMTTGRNFDEVLRLLDSCQLTAKHQVATPVNWKLGEEVIIAGSVTDEQARQRYPAGWKAPKPYIRIVPQPR